MFNYATCVLLALHRITTIEAISITDSKNAKVIKTSGNLLILLIICCDIFPFSWWLFWLSLWINKSNSLFGHFSTVFSPHWLVSLGWNVKLSTEGVFPLWNMHLDPTSDPRSSPHHLRVPTNLFKPRSKQCTVHYTLQTAVISVKFLTAILWICTFKSIGKHQGM